MQNLPQVNTQGSSKNEHAVNNSTANAYDRLHPSEDKGIEHRFSAIFASLKQRLGSGAERQHNDRLATNLRQSQQKSMQSREEAAELRAEKQEKAERERELKERRLEMAEERAEAKAEARAEANQKASALEVSSHDKRHELAAALDKEADFERKDSSAEQDDAAASKALRPSDILAAAMAAVAKSGAATVSGAGATANSGATTTTSSSASTAGALSTGAEGDVLLAALSASGGSGAASTLSGAGTYASGQGVATGATLASRSGAGAMASGAATVASSGAAVASGAGTSGDSAVEGSFSGAGTLALDGAEGSASGNGFGSGSNNSGAAMNAVGLGNDEASPAALAAAQMLQVDGVETDENLAQSLNQLNRNVALPEQRSPSAAEQLASMDGKELKKSLDALARENNVSKLSLKMANPQALAAMRRDAQMLSQLPSSPDTLSAVTGSGEATRLHLMANASNGSGAFSVGAMTGSEGSVEQVAAMGIRQMGVSGRTSTEILIQQNQLRKESHGLVEKTAFTAAARAEQAKQQLESQFLNNQQVTASATKTDAAATAVGGSAAQTLVQSAGAGAANLATSATSATSGATASGAVVSSGANVPNTLAAEVAAKSNALSTLGQDATASKVAGLFGAEAGGSVAAASAEGAAIASQSGAAGDDSRAALLRLAMAQDEITVAAMQGKDNEELDSADADDGTELSAALSSQGKASGASSTTAGSGSAALSQALHSLQQEVAPESTGTNYQNSVFASMLTANALTEDDLAEAARLSEQGVSALESASQAAAGTGAHFDANSASAAVGSNSAEVRAAMLQDEAQAQALVQEQLQAQAQAREELEREFTNMNFSADPTSDAAMLHERVMRMAARNLKHLAVDLNPRDLGKMRIAIELSDNNDALSVTLAAASPETRALLAHTLPVLEDTLAQQNVATNAHILDLNEIEAEEKAEKAVASSMAAVHTLSDPKRVADSELAANDAESRRERTMESNMRWAQSRGVTDGQGRLRGV